ncbi:MAG: polysaccharide pyruvyl transferase family protein [Clostridiales bacterium]|nr:polysaccharide pyruvyl transferase family protein [Clostridiales bacterium]
MNIRLTGYFDKNFGDDLMQLVLIKGLPEYNFFADCGKKEMLLHLKDEKNVLPMREDVPFDAFVNVIGTGFKYDSKMNIVQKILSIPHEKKIREKKACTVGCSVDYSVRRLENALIKRELNKYDYISCRDAKSYEIIRKAAPKKRVFLHNDLVFALPEEYIFPKTDEDCLGIIPTQKIFSAENYAYFEILAKYCDEFIEKTSKKVLLFAFDSGTENDFFAVNGIKSLMKNADFAEIISYNSDPEYIMKNISRCGKIISSRFHGLVASLLSGIPAYAVSDASKAKILCEKHGLPYMEKTGLTYEALSETAAKTVNPVFAPESEKEDAKKHISGLKEYLESEND